ncbi:hypothetical protein FB451DRAFT_1442135 [Mycena latifolia]|nr:hypothetical protein FB451DRAFT_1442135 [Mycena latifolia]
MAKAHVTFDEALRLHLAAVRKPVLHAAVRQRRQGAVQARCAAVLPRAVYMRRRLSARSGCACTRSCGWSTRVCTLCGGMARGDVYPRASAWSPLPVPRPASHCLRSSARRDTRGARGRTSTATATPRAPSVALDAHPRASTHHARLSAIGDARAGASGEPTIVTRIEDGRARAEVRDALRLHLGLLFVAALHAPRPPVPADGRRQRERER